MVTETVNRDRLISINHLTRLRNVLLREQESAHGRFLRHRTELPNLAAALPGRGDRLTAWPSPCWTGRSAASRPCPRTRWSRA